MMKNKFTIGLNKIGINDIDTVGGKNASLGEMIQNLSGMGINIPDGFVITVAGYQNFVAHNNLTDTVKEIIGSIDFR